MASFDDDSDDTLIFPTVAEECVLKIIGFMRAIPFALLKIALKEDGDNCEFSFSRTFQVSSTILQLRVGSLAMSEISYPVANDKMAGEPVLNGRPVLQNLQIYMSKFLEQQRDRLDGTDFSTVENSTMSNKACYVSRLMTSQTQFPDNAHNVS